MPPEVDDYCIGGCEWSRPSVASLCGHSSNIDCLYRTSICTIQGETESFVSRPPIELISILTCPRVAQTTVPKPAPVRITEEEHMQKGLLGSLDEEAFKKLPEVGAAPDMINDHLPSNLDYLDESFGTAAGFREIRDDEFDEEDIPVSDANAEGVLSSVGGETIRILSDSGIKIVEHHFDNLPPMLSTILHSE